MKCEICKKNEAQFYYKESINGKTTEKHLCAECAHKEGLDRIFEHEANSMLTSFGKMMDSFLLPDVDFFGFGRLPSIGEMFEPLLTLSALCIGTERVFTRSVFLKPRALPLRMIEKRKICQPSAGEGDDEYERPIYRKGEKRH